MDAKKKVCIIDDDENIREIYVTKLTQEGFRVFPAASGDEGLALARECKPDVILLDVQMPGKTGIEVLAELKEDKQLFKTPVIMLTNFDNEDTFKKVGKYKTEFYLIKSLTTPEKASHIIREVLSRKL